MIKIKDPSAFTDSNITVAKPSIQINLPKSKYNLAQYCSENYFESRTRFLEAAGINKKVSFINSILLSTKGYHEENLYIDIAWIGNPQAKKIIIHISGTHGVEGFTGSAIQQNLLEQPINLDEDVAIVCVHGLNAYGMAVNRRMNEHNVDLNRNVVNQRKTSPFYTKLNSLINPRSPALLDFFFLRSMAYVLYYGFEAINKAVAGGQYTFPEGLFYGGDKTEEGTKKLLEWIQIHLTHAECVFIIDVHTGLGRYSEDVLVNQELTHYLPNLENRVVSSHSKSKVVGYEVSGLLIEAISKAILQTSKCRKDQVFALVQEFGTYSRYRIIKALRQENMVHNHNLRQGKALDPTNISRQNLLRVFYPTDKKWRHLIVQRGRNLIQDALKLFQNNESQRFICSVVN